MQRELLARYAALIVRKGANVQPGQDVEIYAEADQYLLAELLTGAAYEVGARKVRVFFNRQNIRRLHVIHQDLETLSEFCPHERAELEERLEQLPATIYLTSADPDGLKGVDPEKMQKAAQARFPQLKPYRDKLENQQQWTIAAAASPEWAHKVFPELPEAEAVAKLWEQILLCSRAEEGRDALAAWDEHNANFLKRSAWLNEQKFDHLHYRSAEGTDFKAWLSPEITWAGGGETSPFGVYYNPNIPTEEIFTSPISGQAEGVLQATMPLSYQGQLIRNFRIEFAEGKAVKWQAEEGEELLGRMLTMDAGAGKLGELALVPQSSPIKQSGILFYNTLFDENACCHVAVGAGFSNLLLDYAKYSKEECEAKGINESMIHVDFMIGSDTLDIDGVKADGSRVAILRQGQWAF